ncbi:MAG: 2-oxoglutarate dehydrogenase complex dihydrolipoyllysine-residue succinyltransferase, partial [Gammaproteobacteria bacterium]|nr:2-oxoglutarate dehydrogenase complex dihydrolipoyllysine-residue succinyltransferase [Gammaproteobacteria bacterium]
NAIEASAVSGSGRNGRILKEDVLAYLEDSVQPERHVEPASTEQRTEKIPLHEQQGVEGRIEKRVPMTRLRARIAERLLEAQQNAAILTTFNEVNMKPVMDLRATYKDRFEKEYGVKLGFMSFFVKASVEALKKFPAVNASIDGNDIVYHGYYDIGIAVSGPKGLVVPILRNAEDMTLAQIEQAIIMYATRASENTLAIEDITGGTFTISNGGVFGSMLSTPILNPPQSGILGMHTIKERPMVVNGEIAVLPMMYLALSYDHRIIDGREAVQFLVTIKDMLEEPSRMLLGV